MSNGTVGLDGLMTTEKDELLERMAYLEKQTTDLAEELICLKSALADCLRRVQLLESSRGTHSPMSSHVAPRTASESRASRAPTAAMAGRQSRHTPWMPSTHATSSSRRPPSQVSARSTNLASPSSTAPPALPASKVSGSTGSVVRPLTAASKGGRRGEGDVFRMRPSASASFDCVDAEDLHEPSSWSTIYGLPSSSRVLHQRTLLRRPISTRYSAALHRIRRNSMPLNSVTNPSIWLSQVDIECYCGVVS
ncbi:hypothetical protein EGR_08514 [Echinococcus granulosus]|uniref:Uncharacterized protein n=1 Tax=Echinococcus granulosus TaxID=6210 RepID=W6U622_ECHGR|nr:hypothetical protein EGR_08514 [Echinococcus granulosus]EUB56653.1 hypothetical protein EGR_08514 [Echinococcus granulosus]